MLGNCGSCLMSGHQSRVWAGNAGVIAAGFYLIDDGGFHSYYNNNIVTKNVKTLEQQYRFIPVLSEVSNTRTLNTSSLPNISLYLMALCQNRGQ